MKEKASGAWDIPHFLKSSGLRSRAHLPGGQAIVMDKAHSYLQGRTERGKSWAQAETRRTREARARDKRPQGGGPPPGPEPHGGEPAAAGHSTRVGSSQGRAGAPRGQGHLSRARYLTWSRRTTPDRAPRHEETVLRLQS